MYRFKVNKNCEFNKIDLPDNENFVLTFDNFLEKPEEVLDLGKYNTVYMPVGAEHSWYPGVRDFTPNRFVSNLTTFLEDVISREYFEGEALQRTISRSFLSMVTLKEEELSVHQYCPHIDSSSDMAFAAVLYLCDESHGGTSIYRYKPENTIRVGEDNPQFMSKMIDAVRQSPEEHSGYINGDTSLFDRIGCVPMKFNRLVVFKQNLLHAPDIASTDNCIKNVDGGRFTVVSHMDFEKSV